MKTAPQEDFSMVLEVFWKSLAGKTLQELDAMTSKLDDLAGPTVEELRELELELAEENERK